MKKIILLTLWNLTLSIPMFYMLSCGPSREEVEYREKLRADSLASADLAPIVGAPDSLAKVYSSNSHFTIGIYQVNGCEYIAFVPVDRCQGEAVAVVHAGNCNNPIHYQPVHAVIPGRTGDDPVGKY